MDSNADDASKASTILTRALNGDLNAQFELGRQLEAEKQTEVALGWYKKAAVQGHVESSLQVGLMCLAGDKSSQADAFYWLHKAAGAGSSEAEYQLALMYERGTGVAMNPDESLRWLRIAANHGNTNAMAKLEGLRAFLDQIIPEPPKRRHNSA